jgi:hypothetical protein
MLGRWLHALSGVESFEELDLVPIWVGNRVRMRHYLVLAIIFHGAVAVRWHLPFKVEMSL